MKIISYRIGDEDSFGCLNAGGVVDLKKRLGLGGVTVRAALEDWRGLAQYESMAIDYRLDEVTFLPPVPDPQRILCVGLNYRTHIAETGREPPKFPMLFPRYADTLVGANEPLIAPKISETFDYEGELAFVIGRGGRNIAKEDAHEHVAGYACFNDGTIREFQRHTSQFLPGKNFWRSGSFGPCLVTPDEVGDVGALNIVTRLNGQEVQRARLDDLLFGVPELVAYVSSFLPLQPGDVIATGTTGGVGAFREPPLWMKPGDRVEVEIDRVGLLVNPIEAGPF